MKTKKTKLNLLFALLLLSTTGSADAAVRYVDANSTSPAPPYTNWTTAATILQQAVDAAGPGDEIVVTNGVYAAGGRAVGTDLLANRVAVDKPLTLRSVNGPQFTIIQGAKAPGGGNGDGAIRCVNLADGATLSGFTLTNGATRDWAGDDGREHCGGGVWCPSTNAVLTNCVMVGNSAEWQGGGAAYGTLNNCMLTGNSAASGGGAALGTLNNCTLTGNYANGAGWSGGGGARACNLNNCVLTGNHANGTAFWSGGGGAMECALNHCTLTGNSAEHGGGAASGLWGECLLTNCIVYFNTAPFGANYDDVTLDYCCTTPLPASGTGNTTLDPQLASASHLSAASPCRRAGSANATTGTDIDGEAWATPPSIGCDEYHVGAATGPLTVGIAATFAKVAVGRPLQFAALIDGRTTASSWEFGDGVVSNQPYATHAWTVPGDYAVVLRAYNDSQPEGMSAAVSVHVVMQPVHYVAAGNANPAAPYTSWATAANSIQDAIDAAAVGSELVVSNGVYATGGRVVVGTMTNRVAVDKPLTLRSVNGPQFTMIQGCKVPDEQGGWTGTGNGAIRCVYLADGASLSGFTLTNGGADSAGGVWCESTNATISNCVLAGNSAEWGGGAYLGTLNDCTLTGNSAEWGGGAMECALNQCTLTGNSASRYGGGAAYGTLNNCLLSGNSAEWDGGGAYVGTLNNCTLTGNRASQTGGGAAWGTLNNCIVYFNTATTSGANYYQEQDSGVLNYCCTTPLPTNGVGNIESDPLFVNAAAGDFRLRPNSPCIDAGTNLTAFISTDILGLPRSLDGNGDGIARVDMGAYEFNPYRFEPALQLTVNGLEFTVLGEPGKSVRIERSRDLVNWEPAATVPIPAKGQTLIDPTAITEPFLFYRAVLAPYP